MRFLDADRSIWPASAGRLNTKELLVGFETEMGLRGEKVTVFLARFGTSADSAPPNMGIQQWQRLYLEGPVRAEESSAARAPSELARLRRAMAWLNYSSHARA
jgi:hypothetical protein